MRIVVSGVGYVGLVTGVTLAHIGHNVTCVDNNKEKINLLKKGISPIYEKDLDKLIEDNKKRLSYTYNYKNAYKDADAIFICVGTPERIDGSANLDYVYSVLNEIIESINKDSVIVIKSTVPIGTNEKVEKYIKSKIKNNIKIYVVSNPEFLSQGSAVKDSLYASRIVVGSEDKKAKNIMKKIYEPLTKEPYNVPYIEMARTSAEMVKYASNDFLALKISYINEIANFCGKVGADIEDVVLGMGYDSRIGNKFLKSGIGYGGSCFPKDTKALHWLSKEINNELKTIKACIEVNKIQKTKLYEKLLEDFECINGLNIAILGLTFKPGTDDLRESPSITNIELLLDMGVNVNVYDPIGIANFKEMYVSKLEDDGITGNLNCFDSINKAIKDCDAVMIMTEWSEIIDYDIKNFEKLMKRPNIYDGRNCYKLTEIAKTNVYYYSIGRKTIGKKN